MARRRVFGCVALSEQLAEVFAVRGVDSETTNLAAPRAEFAAPPLGSLGAVSFVVTVPISAFRSLTPEYS
jgi:hypothetical protein